MEFSYDEWRRDRGENLNSWIIHNNVKGWDKRFTSLDLRCCAPGCAYPIDSRDCYNILNVGYVCNLCHYLYNLVAGRAYWVNLHQQDEEGGRRKRP